MSPMEHHEDHAHAPGPAVDHQPTHEPMPVSDAEREPGPNFGSHGMLVLGGQRTDEEFSSPVYVSHLPMFASPHDFQVIIRVTGEAASRYVPSVAHFGTSPFYTFAPEEFSIDELDPAGDGPLRTSFGGSLFRGHFERGGAEIASDVAFDVEQVVHFRQFGENAEVAPRGELRYLCFGERDAAFVAHLISAPPDFDQILAVATSSLSGVSDKDLQAGLTITVPGRSDDVDDRLREGQTVSGAVSAQRGGTRGSIELTVAQEYYLETGDLARRKHQM